MRKFLSVLVLLTAFLLPLASRAQGDVLTVHDGTATSTYVPVYGLYCDDFIKTQMVYPAAELSDMTGGQITSMTFYSSNTNTIAWTSTFNVYLAEVGPTTLSAYVSNSTATSVYTGTLGVSGQMMTITFSTPYNYQGGNLLVGIQSVTDGSFASCTFLGEQVTGASGTGYNGNSVDACSFTQRNFLPKTTFGYTPGSVTCPKPGAITMANLTPTSIDLSFTAGGSETSWYGTISPAVGGVSSMNLTSTSLNLTGLTPNTTYTVGVQSVCSATDSSFARMATFTTPCAAITASELPYLEDFNNYGTGSSSTISACWHKGTSSTAGYPYPDNTSARMIDGTNYLYFYANRTSSAQNYSYAALPDFAVNTNNLMITFQMRRYNSSTTTYTSYAVVGVMTDPTDINTFVGYDTIDLTTAEPGSVHNIEVAFNNYEGPNGNIAILCPPIIPSTATGTSGYNYLIIDNVMVDEIPSCWTITNLSGVAAHNAATLSWTERNGAAMWDVAYTAEGDSVATHITATTNPFTVTGLEPTTTYHFAVKSICLPGVDTANAVNVTLRTLCTPASLPFFEDFNDYATGSSVALNECWHKGTNNTSTAYPYPNNAATASIDGSNYLYFHGSYSATAPKYSYAALPMFDTAVNNLLLTFQVKRYTSATASYTTYLVAGVMSDPTDINTFVPYDTIDLTDAPISSIHEIEVDFSNYTGANGAIALYCPGILPHTTTGTSGYNYAYVDNIAVDLVPSCWTVTDLAVVEGSATETSVTLSWTERNTAATEWNVTYTSAAGTNSVVATTNPFTVTNLVLNTPYTFYVSSICAAADTAKSKSVSARTACPSMMALPYTEDFNGYVGSNSTGMPSGYPNHDLPACWNFIGMSTSTSSSTYPQVFLTSYSTYSNDGNALFFKSSSATTVYAVLPQFALPVDQLMIEFTYKNESMTTSNPQLVLGFISDPTDATTFVPVVTYPVNNVINAVSHDFSLDTNLPTGNYQLAFRYGGAGNSMFLSIDDIYVSQAPTCKQPINVVVIDSLATESSVTLSWAMPNGHTAAEYTVACGLANFDVNDTTTWLGSTTTTTTTATVNGLVAGLGYNFAVRANCTTTDFSAWTLTTGYTACASSAIVIDATHSFYEGFNSEEVPSCWTLVYADSTGATINPIVTVATPAVNGRSISMSSYNRISSGEYHQYIVSPEFSANVPLLCEFSHYKVSTGDTLWFGISTTTNDVSSFTWAQLEGTINRWNPSLYAIPANTKYIAFQYNGDYTQYGYIDEVSVYAHPNFNVTAAVNDSVMGTVTGDTGMQLAYYEYELVATANPNYHFVEWSNGETSDILAFVLMSDTTFTAIFAPDTFAVALNVNDTLMGSVEGAGRYAYNTTATITATANEAYRFVEWNDGNTDATRTITVLSDTTFTATFELIPTEVTVVIAVNDATMGSTTPAAGTYTYHVGDTVNVTATANAGFHFVDWTVDAQTVTSNAVAIILTDIMAETTINIAANFEQDAPAEVTVIIAVNDAAMGSTDPAAGTYTYHVGDTVIAAATAHSGYNFVNWTIDGQTTTNASFMMILTEEDADATITATANFEEIPAAEVTVVIAVNDAAMGTTTPAAGTYTYTVGTDVTVEAVAAANHHFVSWNINGQESILNPVTYTITDEMVGTTVTITATFAQNEGISDIDATAAVIYSQNGNIVVENANGEQVRIYDVVGRLVAQSKGNTTVAAQHSGIYMVQVGNAPAQRVVVVK